MVENLQAPQTADNQAEGILGLMLRLRGLGITDTRLMKALELARHDLFVPTAYVDKAWTPKTLPIQCGQTMHAIDVTARMVAALDPQPQHNVLDIGTGSGFQAALLSHLCRKVHSLDRYKTLLEQAGMRLQRLGIENVTFAQVDGQGGDNGDGLYDGIIADTAYDAPPRKLLEQLVSGGVVVTAIGPPNGEQMLVKLVKIGNRFEREDLFPVRFGTFETGRAASL